MTMAMAKAPIVGNATDKDWWRGAVIYQIYPRSYQDSNGDGIGEHEIFSQGTIRVQGTEAAPVLFTSAEANPRPGDWGAINMMVSEEENLLEFCNVEYGYRGFHAHFAKAHLLNSHFSKNVRGAQFQESQVFMPILEPHRLRLPNTCKNQKKLKKKILDLHGRQMRRLQWRRLLECHIPEKELWYV